jgi:hypothetical protein
MKKRIRCLLIGLILSSGILCSVISSAQPSGDTKRASGPKFVAFYFHSTQRCATCRKIEALSREAIQTSFAEELKKGDLEFRPVNVDEPQNKHYVQDFKLYTKTLIIARVSGEKVQSHRNLTKIWELVYSSKDFSNYVKNEISVFMGGKS